MREVDRAWRPLTLEDVSVLFANAPFLWWVAGGIAIEMAVQKSIRTHADIDILVLRRDHVALRAFLVEWDCWVADPPGSLRPWPVGEELTGGVHDIWCRKSVDHDWAIQVMIDESQDDHWVSRRDDLIRAPLEEITRVTETGIRYVAPVMQLFYKAKNMREKDEIDFDSVITSGIEINTTWLRNAIARCYGEDHVWLERLSQ